MARTLQILQHRRQDGPAAPMRKDISMFTYAAERFTIVFAALFTAAIAIGAAVPVLPVA